LCPHALSFRKFSAGFCFLSQLDVSIGKDTVRVNRIGTQLDGLAQIRQGVGGFLLHDQHAAQK
jgi:hypothetical protein